MTKIVSKGKTYTIQKSINIKENDKDKVLIPNKCIDSTLFILKYEIIFKKDVLNNFKHLQKQLV